MNILITVCGRKGSKGATGKNHRQFLGHPLVYYTLKCASIFKEKYRDQDQIDIIVSSDSEEILDCASNFSDIILHERQASLAQDETPKVSVIQDATIHAETINKIQYDYVLDLDITSPLRKTSDLKNAIDKISNKAKHYDVVFSAVEARRNPYFNMVEVVGNEAVRVKPSNFVCRQQAPEVFDLNASIFCFNKDSLINDLRRSPFEGTCSLILMEETYVIDIDHDKDFTILEILVENYFKDQYPELFV